jgi:hypothetical protein
MFADQGKVFWSMAPRVKAPDFEADAALKGRSSTVALLCTAQDSDCCIH